jgi:hypothetical protein
MTDVHQPISKIHEDVLMRSRIARVILRRLSSSDCPESVGIYGGWGTGKTSLLNLLCILNDSEGAVLDIPLYFEIIDVWPHERVESLLAPVITRLLSLLNAMPKLQKAAAPIAARILLTTGFIVTDTVLKQLGSSRENIQSAYKDASDAFPWLHDLRNRILETEEKRKKDFSELVRLVRTQIGAKKIVLCLDNLDRCSPEHVVQLLESVKNYLTVEGCIWVFAVDAQVLASYIDRKYEGTAMDGNSYLDKIIPEQYHIPSPSIKYEGDLLDEFLRTAMSEMPERFPANWHRFAGVPKVLVPRRLLKSARKYQEIYRLETDLGTSAHDDIVFALILLYHAWPDFYRVWTSENEEHIQGILIHFYPAEWSPSSSSPVVPLDDSYLKDQELRYFIQLAFLEESMRRENRTARDLISAMRFLRQVGLP